MKRFKTVGVGFCILLSVIMVSGCAMQSAGPKGQSPKVAFDWFHYVGQDKLADIPLKPGHFRNPIVSGFYPDPSVVRVDNDYYMIHSSFSYVPGVPIFHSTDLVNWRPLGHVLTRESQLRFPLAQVSRGIFAPTIRYHDGVFYVITTGIDDAGGNFIVTATDPAGPWSDPIFLPEIDGIDPDIFFDDDGRIYISHNGPPPDNRPLYEGHRAIYLWEFDPEAKKVIPPGRLLVDGGVNIEDEPVWIEAPHIYKIDGWYYLVCAEGGTAEDHSAVVFRARSLTDRFEPWHRNPILTQRDLDPGRPYPVATAGHADLVQTTQGEWWAVFLATRNYDSTFFNTGRETFMLPVTWQDGWPMILEQGETVPYQVPVPRGLPPTPDAEPLTGNFTRHDEFTDAQLSPHWTWLRQVQPDWLSLKGGQLELTALENDLSVQDTVAFVAQRQQHLAFDVSTALELPLADGVSAGITAFQNETSHYYLGVRKVGDRYEVFLELAGDGEARVIKAINLRMNDGQKSLVLGIRAETETLHFYLQERDDDIRWLVRDADARVLSTQRAGGFVGTMLGLHARKEQPADAPQPIRQIGLHRPSGSPE